MLSFPVETTFTVSIFFHVCTNRHTSKKEKGISTKHSSDMLGTIKNSILTYPLFQESLDWRNCKEAGEEYLKGGGNLKTTRREWK
jgi:hypothetical protein